MAEQRQLYITRIILSFIIATVIFITGFLTSYAISASKYSSIVSSQNDLRYGLLSLELERQLAIDSCEIFSPYTFAKELDNTGKSLNLLEKNFGKWDKKVREEKKIYSMLEIQHFLLINEHNEKCNKTIPTILFFYSNDPDFEDEAEKIGLILSAIKNSEKDLMIYSFDYAILTPLTDILKMKYNITSPNVIVINEETKIEYLKNINEVKEHLG